MAIPGYEKFMLPMLKLVADQREQSISAVRDKLAVHFRLAEDDLREVLPSGKQTVFYNRVGWAKTYLQKAGLLASSKRGYFHITQRGQSVLAEGLEELNRKSLEQYDEFQEFVNRPKNPLVPGSTTVNDKTPLEALEAAHEEIQRALESELLERLKQSTWRFFERLVIDLLLKMGYGGSRKDAGHAISRSGDEGIDGIIKEDRLGLDIIYLQAKRWNNPVGRPDIQKFVGALAGQRAKKGVFITTSQFTDGATEYVKGIENKVVLIDGQQLARYMIQLNLGVSINEVYEVKQVDTDYFEE